MEKVKQENLTTSAKDLLRDELRNDVDQFLPTEIAFTKQLIKRNPVFEKQGKEYIAQCLSLILTTKERIRNL